jgi:hypothetical protein
MTFEIGVDVQGMKEQLSKLDGFDASADKHIKEAMEKSLIALRGAIVPNVPVGVSGRWRGSIGYEITGSIGSGITGTIGSSLTGEVYPEVIDLGREPGSMPPPSELVRWVQLKLQPEAWKVYSVAFNVARAIAAHGIEGIHVMENGLKACQSAIDGYFRQAGDDISKDMQNGR